MDVTPIDSPVSALNTVSQAPTRKTIDHALIAKMHIREGKPFLDAAVAGGYSEATARRGIRFLLLESSLLSDAVRREYELMERDVTKLKPIAVARLYREIVAPDSPNAMKAIELAGRFKETDWYVRNTDIQLGVFMGLADHSPEAKDLDKFNE